MSKKFILPIMLMMAMASCSPTVVSPSNSTSQGGFSSSSSSSQVDENDGTISAAEAIEIGQGLAADEITEESYTIKDVITEVTEAYTEQYKNTTFNMGDFIVFRAKLADGVDPSKIAVGNTVTLTAQIQNYKGKKIETYFATITKIEGQGSSGGSDVENPSGVITAAEAIKIGQGLGADEITDETYTIRDNITSVTEAYSEQYKNTTFNMGDFIVFRAKLADGVDPSKIAVGNTVTLTAQIQNYKGEKIETYYATITKIEGNSTGGGSTGGDTGDTNIGSETTGAHSVTFDFAAAKEQVAAYDESYKDQTQVITVDGYEYTTINCYNSSNASVFMLGSKKYTSAALVANKTAIDGEITEVVITFPKGSSKNADYSVSFSDSAITSVTSTNLTKIEGVDLEEKTVIFSNTEGGSYFSLSSVSTKYNGQITSITVYYN